MGVLTHHWEIMPSNTIATFQTRDPLPCKLEPSLPLVVRSFVPQPAENNAWCRGDLNIQISATFEHILGRPISNVYNILCLVSI